MAPAEDAGYGGVEERILFQEPGAGGVVDAVVIVSAVTGGIAGVEFEKFADDVCPIGGSAVLEVAVVATVDIDEGRMLLRAVEVLG